MMNPAVRADAAVRFMVDADADPAMLPRLLQPFAKRGLLPERTWSYCSGPILHVEIAMETIPGEFLPLIEGNLRQIVGVRSVTQIQPGCLHAAA
jgi:hypothetical protein